jgi:hypothetical protein
MYIGLEKNKFQMNDQKMVKSWNERILLIKSTKIGYKK